MINRIYHRWEKWECYKAGFYSKIPLDGLTEYECKLAYASFFSDLKDFNIGIRSLFKNWKYSCEHFLTNRNINRVAWIGQASICIMYGVSSYSKSGFKLLSEKEQSDANLMAKCALDIWVKYKINEKKNINIS